LNVRTAAGARRRRRHSRADAQVQCSTRRSGKIKPPTSARLRVSAHGTHSQPKMTCVRYAFLCILVFPPTEVSSFKCLEKFFTLTIRARPLTRFKRVLAAGRQAYNVLFTRPGLLEDGWTAVNARNPLQLRVPRQPREFWPVAAGTVRRRLRTISGTVSRIPCRTRGVFVEDATTSTRG